MYVYRLKPLASDLEPGQLGIRDWRIGRSGINEEKMRLGNLIKRGRTGKFYSWWSRLSITQPPICYWHCTVDNSGTKNELLGIHLPAAFSLGKRHILLYLLPICIKYLLYFARQNLNDRSLCCTLDLFCRPIGIFVIEFLNIYMPVNGIGRGVEGMMYWPQNKEGVL